MVSCRGLLKSSLAILVLGFAVLVGWMQMNGITDGTFPLLHIGAPWGINATQIPSLKGKFAIVTGASSGLGLGVARRRGSGARSDLILA
eukprot:6181720-Pleurochrysis_carterae.AAC.1